MKVVRLVLLLCMAIGFVGADDGWEDFICFGTPNETPVAHPTNCSLFFVCDGGFGVKHPCPENSFFDPAKLECDPNYQCDRSGATTLPSQGGTTATTKMPNPSMPGPQTNVSDHPIKCPPEDTLNVTMLANPNNRSEYYLCYYGKPVRFECPRRYVFSSADKGCIPVSQTAVNSQQTSPPSQTDTTSDPNIPSKPSDSINPVCPKGIRRFFPHPKRCENFVYCENGFKSIQRCPTFYHWDVTSKRCKLRGRAICIESVPVALRRAFY